MGLSLKDMFKSNANMQSGHTSRVWDILSGLKQTAQAEAATQIWHLSSYFGPRAGFNLQFNKSKPSTKIYFIYFFLPAKPTSQHSCPEGLFHAHSLHRNSSLSSMQPEICIRWLHTLTWLNDVWPGVTPDLSHPVICLRLPSAQMQHHTHTHTDSLSCALKIEASY